MPIVLIVVPIILPLIEGLGFNLIWFAILVAVNLQTSFLTPPFGYSLFYIKGVAPPEINIRTIYRGITPFVALQFVGLSVLVIWPDIVLWVPRAVFGS